MVKVDKICRMMSFPLAVIALAACEIVDDDMDRHVSDSMYVSLDDVAKVLSHAPIGKEHILEVKAAVSSSSGNGYDEEYTVSDMFTCPGAGVGDDIAVRGMGDARTYTYPLSRLIEDYVRSSPLVRSSDGIGDPEKWLAAVRTSDMQIYWPFSENWDGSTFPVITFDPEDGSEVNVGYRIVEEDGSRHIEEIVVDEAFAEKNPVWVVNRNSDAGFMTLDMLKKEHPDWGNGGGSITVTPKSVSGGGKILMLKDFTARRHYDSWFAGASEFFVKIGYLEDFTASTEAELKIYNPKITDFMIVVRRKQKDVTLSYNMILLTEWSENMESCAFMVTEDDGGTRTDWSCKAKVFVAGKSYGVEMSLPFNSRDDIVWRGMLGMDMIEDYSGQKCRFGDIELTFEVVTLP